MKKTTGYVYFRYEMVEKKIVGTRASFTKANRGHGEAYEELVDLMSKQPSFTLEVIELQKRTEKPKQSYKGMDCDFMRDYLIAKQMYEELNVFKQIEAFAKNNDRSKYPLIKKFFLNLFKGDDGTIKFDYAEAKRIVKEYRDNQTMKIVASTLLEDDATADNI